MREVTKNTDIVQRHNVANDVWFLFIRQPYEAQSPAKPLFKSNGCLKDIQFVDS